MNLDLTEFHPSYSHIHKLRENVYYLNSLVNILWLTGITYVPQGTICR
jgi:hypothetical protein